MIFYTLVKLFLVNLLVRYTNVMNPSAIVYSVTLKVGLAEGFVH
jgi:hypothetical protein